MRRAVYEGALRVNAIYREADVVAKAYQVFVEFTCILNTPAKFSYWKVGNHNNIWLSWVLNTFAFYHVVDLDFYILV